MIECIEIPVIIPKQDTPEKVDIKRIICAVFPSSKEWPNVHPEEILVTQMAGYANRNYVIERPGPAAEDAAPRKVFFKIHGDLDGEISVFEHLVPDKYEEAQLCHNYGESGLGTRVYGFFRTIDGSFGRVDEYLDARTLEPEDVEHTQIRASIARAHATFHSLKPKGRLKQTTATMFCDTIIPGLARFYKREKLKKLAQDVNINMDALIDWDYGSTIRAISKSLELIDAKQGWSIHDVQYGNVMVVEGTAAQAHRVILIDFEFVFRNFRAFDIGGHWLHKGYKWFDETNKIVNCRPYTYEEKIHFCKEYAEQWNKHTGDSDTGQQILTEAELGYMLSITFEIHNMLCYMDDVNDQDSLNLLGLNKLFEQFMEQRRLLKIVD